MVERDVAWFYRLLLLCPKLAAAAGLRANRSRERFNRKSGAIFEEIMRRKTISKCHRTASSGRSKHLDSGKTITSTKFHAGEKCVTCRVVKNLHVHRHELRRRSGERINEAFL